MPETADMRRDRSGPRRLLVPADAPDHRRHLVLIALALGASVVVTDGDPADPAGDGFCGGCADSCTSKAWPTVPGRDLVPGQRSR